jgi:hypothetical protein
MLKPALCRRCGHAIEETQAALYYPNGTWLHKACRLDELITPDIERIIKCQNMDVDAATSAEPPSE